jgi:hypothetical protein
LSGHVPEMAPTPGSSSRLPYGHVISDECHHASCVSFERVAVAFDGAQGTTSAGRVFDVGGCRVEPDPRTPDAKSVLRAGPRRCPREWAPSSRKDPWSIDRSGGYGHD